MRHIVTYHTGVPDKAWFQCIACEHEWSNLELSRLLLDLLQCDIPFPAKPDSAPAAKEE